MAIPARGRFSLELLLAVVVAAGATAADKYEILGPGGAGGIFNCDSSPVDPNFMLVCCDMTGCYRSYDGGHTWTMMDWKQIESCCHVRSYFHPKNANIVVWKDFITRDKAMTWQRLAGMKTEPWGNATHSACSADDRPVIFIGSDKGIWSSDDDGKTWKQIITGGACGGIQVLADNTAYAAAGKTLYKWVVGKGEPAAVPAAGIKDNIKAFAVGGNQEQHTVHVVAGKDLLTSADAGATWRTTLTKPDLAEVVMARTQPKVAYACTKMELYVTKDDGATWTSTFQYGKNAPHTWIMREMYWGYYIVPGGLGCGQGNPEIVTLSSQAELYISTDYGATWTPRHTKELGPMPDGGATHLQSTGLEVTASYDYFFDPNEPNRHYIGFGDITFTRSLDGGKTWAWGGKGNPWLNSGYDLAFDPYQKGRLYLATSRFHEIMHWICCTDPKSASDKGGVVVSDDYGATWKPLSGGLPVKPCTSIQIDRKNSKPGALVMYAGFWGKGVFKSEDSGVTWKEKPGVGRSGNQHVMRISIHPKTNDIYANTGANREGARDFKVPGGLWKSSDGGITWTELTTGQDLKWMNGFAVHPENPNIIFVTAADIPAAKQGGIYRTTDGGATWQRMLTGEKSLRGYIHGMFIDFNPYDPSVLYCGSTSGLWGSQDGGDTWEQIDQPFEVCHRVRIDPKDHSKMYILTDGCGVIRMPVWPPRLSGK